MPPDFVINLKELYQNNMAHSKGCDFRHEWEFLFPTFSRYSLVISFPSWVGNTVFHSHSQSQKMGTLFFIPIPNPKIWEHCFSFPFPIPTLNKNILGISLGNKVVSMHPFSILGVKFTLNKDNLFKLNTKHEFAQLDRLNIVLNMKEEFQDSVLHSQLFGKWDAISHSQMLGIKSSFPFPIPKVGN